MYHYVANRGRKALLKKIFSVFLIFTLYFNTFNSAFAGAAEKWTIEEVVYNNVSKTLNYTASRPNAIASNDYLYKAKVGVDAARTGSTAATMIRYGLAGAAMVAIIQGVGWIIENGVVKKKADASTTKGTIKTLYYTYVCQATELGSCIAEYKMKRGVSDKQHKTTVTFNGSTVRRFQVDIYNSGTTGSTIIQEIFEVKVDTTTNNDYEPVPDSELGEAIQNSPSAPQVIPEIYSPNNPVPRPSPAPEAVETALDNAVPQPRENPVNDIKNKPNKDTDGDGKPDVYDPSLPSNGMEFKLPVFCSWAAVVCDWYSQYKEDSKKTDDHRVKEITFWSKVTDFLDWFKKDDSLQNEPPLKPDELPKPPFNADAFKATPGCPPPIPVHVSIGTGGNATISYEPICQFAEKWSFVAPLIGFLSGAMILIGVGRKGEDSDI